MVIRRKQCKDADGEMYCALVAGVAAFGGSTYIAGDLLVGAKRSLGDVLKLG